MNTRWLNLWPGRPTAGAHPASRWAGPTEAGLHTSAAATARRAWPVEGLALGVVGLLVLLANLPFWQVALAGRRWGDPASWRFVACTAVILVGLHGLPLLLVAGRRSLKPLLALMVVCSAVALHMVQSFGVVLDPSMLRNAMRTDVREASELMTPGLLLSLGGALLASLLLWRVPLRRRTWKRAALMRGLTLLGLLLATVTALLLGFQDFGSLMRNQKELRYRITPGNVFYSAGSVLAADLKTARRQAEPLQPIQQLASLPGRKPRLLVLVVGETARAMNFSLNGYGRNTNPELARLPIINFPQTRSCGTSTEVSLPCMFSSLGRADYDEDRIRHGESLVQLLQRAGAHVVWLDNQSGCKGVCNGVPTESLTQGQDPVLCPGGNCLDGVLLQGLQRVVIQARQTLPARDTVVVLHQLGNHGPAYAKRYPPEFARFGPACTDNALGRCRREDIVNAYDNAIGYTDHLLAQAITLLRGQQDHYDVGLMYASDHGESLGENGLYLHGMPLAVAPREQVSVPMLWWFGGEGARGWDGLDAGCLRQRALQPSHHDNLYHSVMGLMQLRTPAYHADRDLVSGCRPAVEGAGGAHLMAKL